MTFKINLLISHFFDFHIYFCCKVSAFKGLAFCTKNDKQYFLLAGIPKNDKRRSDYESVFFLNSVPAISDLRTGHLLADWGSNFLGGGGATYFFWASVGGRSYLIRP